MDDIVTMLSKFPEILDGHLGTVTAAQYRFKTSPPNARPIFSAPSHSEQRVREFAKKEFDNMRSWSFIDPSQPEGTGPILFAWKKTASMCFGVYYRLLNAIHVQELYCILHVDDFID